MNIPDAALEAAAEPLDRYTRSDALDVAHDVLQAALPHLVADHRERLAQDVVTLTVMAEDPHNLPERRAHLASKASGVELALSKLDELTR